MRWKRKKRNDKSKKSGNGRDGSGGVPKLCGGDMELGNFVLGSENSSGTGRVASRALLSKIEGLSASNRSYGYSYGYGYGTNRHRVRWSFHAHGLISGDLYYSPYAFGQGQSGLVDDDTRYTPYAFGQGHSGLIVDGTSGSYSVYAPPYRLVRPYHIAPNCNVRLAAARRAQGYYTSRAQMQKSYREAIEARRAGILELAQARQQERALRANSGKEVIARYLKGRNIEFKVTRTLNIAGKIVSVDFLLNGGNTILKYWNPAEIQSLGQPQERKRKFYDRYVKSWNSISAEHLKAGGRIHQIVSSDSNEILASLPLCPDLNGTGKAYAVATKTHP